MFFISIITSVNSLGAERGHVLVLQYSQNACCKIFLYKIAKYVKVKTVWIIATQHKTDRRTDEQT